jgi:ABC-type multidrug transport system ATPase subunit
MLQIQNLTIVLGKNAILQNLSLTLERGQCVIIEGKNRSGKTTLLRALIGEVKPTHGQIMIDHRNINGLSTLEKKHYHRSLGVLLQHPLLRQHDVVNIEHKTLVKELSFFEQKKLDLARALKNHPSLILLDEPLLGFDSENAAEVRDTLQELKAAHVTMLIFTTDRTAYNFLNTEKIIQL